MSTLTKNDGSNGIVPAVHLEFIQNQAGAVEGDGMEGVEQYHRALFLHHHAKDLERHGQEARIHQDRLSHLENRLNAAYVKLSGLDKLVPVHVEGEADVRPALPWHAWDRSMFVVAALGIGCLLLFGVLNISFNLLESGLITFQENRIRAYFWAALLPVGALGVKVGWDFLRSDRRRDIYLWSCLGIGVAGVLIWAAAYAAIYPSLSKTTSERIGSLSVFDTTSVRGNSLAGINSAGTKWIDVITVGAQAVAEIFLSAVLGMYMTSLYARHRPVRLAGNPLFTQLDEERRSLEEDVARERLALGEARGNQIRLEQQLAALVAYAKSMFQKEAAQRRDQSQQKRVLLDQISEQLRTQLETVENHNRTLRGHGDSSIVLGSANGK